MTTKQLGKAVDDIKIKLDNEQVFDKRLELLDDLAVILEVLLRRCRKDVDIISYAMVEIDKLKTLVR
jgi:hypothetical protein